MSPASPLAIPLRSTMLMRAAYTAPSAWTAHIPFAGWLVETLRPATFVELGTHYGTSYFAICQAIVANDIACKCFAVDTWEGDEHAGEYGEEVFEQVDAYHARHYAGFSQLMRMRFEDAVQSFEDGAIDLLHIDGLHSYEAVSEDFRTWLPKLSKRAVVLFHDTFERSRGFGVWRLWAELKDRYPSFEFTHGHGLGVLVVGDDARESLACLPQEADSQSASTWNGTFERLGGAIDADLEIERLNRALRHERAKGSEMLEPVAALRSDLALVYQEMTALQESVRQSEAPFAAVRGDVALVYQAVRQLQEADGLDTTLHAIRSDLALVFGTLKRLDAAAGPSSASLEALRIDVTSANEAIARLEQEQASPARFDAVHAELTTVQRQLDQVAGVLDTRAASAAVDADNIKALGSQLADQAGTIASVQEAVARVDAGLRTLPGGDVVDAMRSQLDLQNARLDGIVEALAEDARVLAGIAEHQRRGWRERIFGRAIAADG